MAHPTHLLQGLILGVLLVCSTQFANAQERKDKPAPAASDETEITLTKAESAFQEMLSNSDLVGQFSIVGRGTDRPPKAERYEVRGVSKISDSTWIINARIVYGKIDVVLPVPVNVIWAKETPMIALTNVTIPGLGSAFGCRVLFHDGKYAGTWQHGKVGGHMWGVVEKSKPAQEADKISE